MISCSISPSCFIFFPFYFLLLHLVSFCWFIYLIFYLFIPPAQTISLLSHWLSRYCLTKNVCAAASCLGFKPELALLSVQSPTRSPFRVSSDFLPPRKNILAEDAGKVLDNEGGSHIVELKPNLQWCSLKARGHMGPLRHLVNEDHRTLMADAGVRVAGEVVERLRERASFVEIWMKKYLQSLGV